MRSRTRLVRFRLLLIRRLVGHVSRCATTPFSLIPGSSFGDRTFSFRRRSGFLTFSKFASHFTSYRRHVRSDLLCFLLCSRSGLGPGRFS
ncbi:hypothetical protein F4805DRAFT_317761 [Annulohypoxylon moriforme]|nr:hypothetical protein F4805DRAFT_317761 [Annulohypoxylon moriforme]